VYCCCFPPQSCGILLHGDAAERNYQQCEAAKVRQGVPAEERGELDYPQLAAKTDDISNRFVRIESTQEGRKMIAQCDIPAGSELFCEDPILFIQTQDRDLVTVCNAAVAQFLSKSPSTRTRILSFHVPVDDCEEESIRKIADADVSRTKEEVEQYVKVGLIMKANSAVAQEVINHCNHSSSGACANF